MHIPRQIPIFLLILLSGIEQTFACILDEGGSIDTYFLLYGNTIVGVTIVAYIFYRLLLYLFLNEKDALKTKKGKTIIIRAIIILASLFFINSISHWFLVKLLC